MFKKVILTISILFCFGLAHANCQLSSGKWTGYYHTVFNYTGKVKAYIKVDKRGAFSGNYHSDNKPIKQLTGYCKGNIIYINGGLKGTYKQKSMNLSNDLVKIFLSKV